MIEWPARPDVERLVARNMELVKPEAEPLMASALVPVLASAPVLNLAPAPMPYLPGPRLCSPCQVVVTASIEFT